MWTPGQWRKGRTFGESPLRSIPTLWHLESGKEWQGALVEGHAPLRECHLQPFNPALLLLATYPKHT